MNITIGLIILAVMIFTVVGAALYQNYQEDKENGKIKSDSDFDILPQAMRDEELLRNINAPECPADLKILCIQEYDKRKKIYDYLNS